MRDNVITLGLLVFSFASVLLTLTSLREDALHYWYLFFYPMVLAASRHGVRGAWLATAVTYASLLLVYVNLLPMTGPQEESAMPDDLTFALASTLLMVIAALGLGSMRDNQKRMQERANHFAHYDPLTGLFNRRGFLLALESSGRPQRRTHGPGAVLYVDLDHFKTVNDSFGHDAGDEVLRELAGVLRQQTRDTDLLVRMGGDEFAVLLQEVDEQTAQRIANRILEAIRALNIQREGVTAHVTASLGIALFAEGAADVDDLLARADAAMYEAKQAGRDAISIARPPQ